MSIYDKYEIVVGLEVHAQLKTNTKIFAPDATAFGADPNTQVSYITLGHPGTLPVLNEKAIAYAVKMGLATNCSIEKYNRFSRKNYFYPDLPKGYQISQFATPICFDGYLSLEKNNKKIRINRIHLEEDAGKSTHDQDPSYSLIDLNRAGVCLIEIVSEPDIRSADEAYEYVAKIRQLVQYLDVCDGNMEEGSLRCDANVSVRLKGDNHLNERAEIKNMNSLRNVKRAIIHEAKRQIDIVESGGRIEQQTRSFDAEKGTTFPLRSKEMAHDYRYFPEPDLPPVVLNDTYIAELKSQMPALPEALKQKFIKELNLSAYDAAVLTDDRAIATYFQELMQHTNNAKVAAHWVTGNIKSYLNKNNLTIEDFSVPPKAIAQLIALITANKVNNLAASQQLLPALIQQPNATPEMLAKSLNLIIDNNQDEVAQLIADILAKFPKKVKAYRFNGKKGMVGFFMGQLMRATKGKLNPKEANKLLIEQLNK